jgi:hypothetical protein
LKFFLTKSHGEDGGEVLSREIDQLCGRRCGSGEDLPVGKDGDPGALTILALPYRVLG